MARKDESYMKLFFMITATTVFGLGTISSIMMYREGGPDIRKTYAVTTTVHACLTVLGVAAMILP